MPKRSRAIPAGYPRNPLKNAVSSPVTFRVTSGPGELIGTNPINAEAGIATILLRTTGVKGDITVSAVAENVTREGTGTISPRDP